MTAVFKRVPQAGFSLLELAISVGVVGLLLSLALPAFIRLQQAEQDQQEALQLQEAKRVLLEFVAVEKRLPCPATPESQGQEARDASGECQKLSGGFPSATLAYLGRVNRRLLAVNQRAVPLRYSVAQIDGLPRLSVTERLLDPNVVWASTSSSIELRQHAAGGCGHNQFRANNVYAVLISAGRRDYASADEQENRDADQQFVAAPYTQRVDCGFDDQLIWLSKADVLYRALITGEQR